MGRARRLTGAAALLAVCGAWQVGTTAAAQAAETGGIAGSVTDASTSAPIAGIEVCAFALEGEEGPSAETCAKTEASGDYSLTGLAPGEYDVAFIAPPESDLDYVTQFYAGVYSPAEARSIKVSADATTSDVNAKLQRGGQIQGTVTNASTGKGVQAFVCAANTEVPAGECAFSDADGEYEISRLPTGRYEVSFQPVGPEQDLIGQYYDDASSSSGAKLVSVTAPETTSGIDAQMQEGGWITGIVTDGSTGAPVSGIVVCALNAEEHAVACTRTQGSGSYSLGALPPGEYSVGFTDLHKTYLTEYFNGVFEFAQATRVAVAVNRTATAINAALLKGPASVPENTSPPAVTGAPIVGETLHCTTGAWSGTPPPTLTYAWLRDGRPIPGATASSYLLTSADEGNAISCVVTARNPAGHSGAESGALGISAAPPQQQPPKATASAKPLLQIAQTRLTFTHGHLSVHVRCLRAACHGEIQLIAISTSKKPHGRSHTSQVVLATATISLRPGSKALVTLHITGAGRRALARTRRPRHLAVAVTLHGLPRALTSVSVR